MDLPLTIHHFYHIYADGAWQEPVTEHLQAHRQTNFNVTWRRRMTYFTVTCWRDAVLQLSTHHAYGCHWMQLNNNWVFGGNFWWAHMSDLRLLPQPRRMTRWQAEGWVGQLPSYLPNFRVYDPAPAFPGKIKARVTLARRGGE